MVIIKKSGTQTSFHFIYVLFHLTVVTGQDAVRHMEMGEHGLVIRDTLGIVALHDTPYLIRGAYRFLLHHLEVMDDVQHDVRGDDGQTGYLLIRKPFVLHLDKSLPSQFLGREVIADGHWCSQVGKFQ